MLMVMDVGNTNIKAGLYQDDILQCSWRLGSEPTRTADEYGVIIKMLLNDANYQVTNVDGIIISSVMPSLNYTLEHVSRSYFHCDPLFVGNGIKTGMNIRYDNVGQLGADRIVNAVAAAKLYGYPVIVVDFGTATTFSVVDERGEFIGGAICPGIKMSADAMVKTAAKLPKIELMKPDAVIQKSTVKNMQSGILYGFSGMVEYMLKRMKKEINTQKVKVVATGGMCEMISEEVSAIDILDRTLTLSGLKMIYELNR